jgi:hypothetical protein
MKKSLLFYATLFLFSVAGAVPHTQPTIPSTESRFFFAENKGQITDQDHVLRKDIQFCVRGAGGMSIFIGNGELHYQFCKVKTKAEDFLRGDITQFGKEFDDQPGKQEFEMYRMDVQLIGANKNAHVAATGKQPYYERYYTSAAQGAGNIVSTYSRLTYSDVYPGIDWILYIAGDQVKYEFVVKQGGNVADIQLRYMGAVDLRIARDGSLAAYTPYGIISEHAPYSYQANGKVVASGYRLKGNIVSYDVAAFEGGLMIDPAITWATYYGGADHDNSCAVSIDPSGNVYTSGNTYSTSAIATTGAYLATYAGTIDAYLVKFTSGGTRLWATYYGGSSAESGDGVAADAFGNVFMGGLTHSSSGISTPGAWQTVLNGGKDGFVVKFDGTGARQWASYYGGDSLDAVSTNGVAVDMTGNVMITGDTKSIDSISSAGAWQPAIGGGYDAYVAKFSSNGVFKWGTYYGGTATDIGYCVAADAGGNVCISGNTESATGIASAGAFLATPGGGTDAFAAKFDSTGIRIWGTYYGNTGIDMCDAVRADISGNTYIAGRTNSTSGIATTGCHQPAIAGGMDAYLVKFDNAGNRLWGTYYGGTSGDYGNCLATDLTGNVYMGGFTGSATGLATAGAYQTANGGLFDAFLVQFTGAGSRLWATYFGDTATDQAFGVAAGSAGNVYIAGLTRSLANIATTGAHQIVFGGVADAFLAKFDLTPSAAIEPNSLAGVISVYPNPASSNITIRRDRSLQHEMVVSISDVVGRTRCTSVFAPGDSEHTFDLGNIPAGVYLLNASWAEGNYTTKIVVNR